MTLSILLSCFTRLFFGPYSGMYIYYTMCPRDGITCRLHLRLRPVFSDWKGYPRQVLTYNAPGRLFFPILSRTRLEGSAMGWWEKCIYGDPLAIHSYHSMYHICLQLSSLSDAILIGSCISWEMSTYLQAWYSGPGSFFALRLAVILTILQSIFGRKCKCGPLWF